MVPVLGIVCLVLQVDGIITRFPLNHLIVGFEVIRHFLEFSYCFHSDLTRAFSNCKLLIYRANVIDIVVKTGFLIKIK